MTNLAVLKMPARGSKIETPQKTRVRSGTLPSGITEKMNVFARHVADGLSLADAYRAAFNTSSMKAKTVRDDASRLAQHSGVRAAIKGHRAQIEARNRIFAQERSERIWEMIWGLIEGDDVPPAVKVRTLDLAARLAGMFRERTDCVLPTAAEIERELKFRMAKL